MNEFKVGDIVMLRKHAREAMWARGASTYLTIKGLSNKIDFNGYKMLQFEEGAFPELLGDSQVSPVWFELVKRVQKKIKSLPEWW